MTEALPELRDPLPGERLSSVLTHPSPTVDSVVVSSQAPKPHSQPPVAQQADSLSPQERSERARTAAKARWAKAKIDWETIPIEEALIVLADMRAEGELGGNIVQRRISQARVEETVCYNPSCMRDGQRTRIDIGSGRFAGKRDRINKDTGAYESAYACSAACWLYVTKNFLTTG